LQRFSTALARAAFAAALLLHAAGAAAQCLGDCNRDGRVTIAELVSGVNVALGASPLSACRPIDANGDREVGVDELIGAVNSALLSCPIFPADYRSDYVEVRECVKSIEHSDHGQVNVRVYANRIAADAYLANAPTLPVGSVVVKEEFSGDDCCDDARLVRWRAMRKEEPGFDPADGDWHWQWVAASHKVVFDDKSTCIGCHAASECVARDYMCQEGEAPRGRLVPVLENLPKTVLSVSGTAPDDVYAVGADTRDGLGPQIYHYDGESWTRLLTGDAGKCALETGCDLWWISVTPIDGSFYMAGDGGLILEYDLATKTFTRHTTPGDALLFGVWGPSEDNLFAVGDNKSIKEPGAAVYRFDGKTWRVEDVSGARPAGVPPLNKVWGPSGTDVYAVGQEGTIIHYDGKTWFAVPSGADVPLFTVHGNGSIVAVSGGLLSVGTILELAGTSVADVTPPGAVQFNGIFIQPDGGGVAVGYSGSIAVRTGACWEARESGLDTDLDFHTTWVDPEGGIWAVGGDLSVDLSVGMLAYGGTRTIGSTIHTPAP
jgi:hypothetical protein